MLSHVERAQNQRLLDRDYFRFMIENTEGLAKAVHADVQTLVDLQAVQSTEQARLLDSMQFLEMRFDSTF